MNKVIMAACSFLIFSACSDNNDKTNPEQLQESKRGIIVEASSAAAGGNWYVHSPMLDGVEGVRSEQAMAEFKLTHPREIVVAVLDSGVDIEHEDLQGKIWVNPGEQGVDERGIDKAINGIDDDGNGYVDDVHGWNYLGSSSGVNINEESLEMTREMVRFEARLAKGEVLTKEETAYYEEVKAAYEAQEAGAKAALADVEPQEPAVTAATTLLKEKLGLEDYSQEALEKISSKEEDILKAQKLLLDITAKYRSVGRFYRIIAYYNDVLKYYLNKSFNPRTITGDDTSDFSDIGYGNNNVEGPDAAHGTHVAGIIAAIRNNGIGVNGVAENVKIMSLRMVPNGDERDKDIALAVRYAVDNGAHIINMSFGKDFSPYKSQVDDAFLYAAEKGVLIFHSAGNGASNNDEVVGYPNRTVKNSVDRGLLEKVPTWLEIGASAKTKDINMVAFFSDYGKVDVDLFSPGHLLNSTIPDNQYAVFSGTSMAGPAAAGVAALLMSNFPEMTAAQAKAIILDEVRLYPNLEVRIPGAQKFDVPVPFASLSASGGVIDAYSAVALAKYLSEE